MTIESHRAKKMEMVESMAQIKKKKGREFSSKLQKINMSLQETEIRKRSAVVEKMKQRDEATKTLKTQMAEELIYKRELQKLKRRDQEENLNRSRLLMVRTITLSLKKYRCENTLNSAPLGCLPQKSKSKTSTK